MSYDKDNDPNGIQDYADAYVGEGDYSFFGKYGDFRAAMPLITFVVILFAGICLYIYSHT